LPPYPFTEHSRNEIAFVPPRHAIRVPDPCVSHILPGGGLQHITMINVPIFGATSPASFRDAIAGSQGG
jgi:hypothetical protein